jgi:hypothetical protein
MSELKLLQDRRLFLSGDWVALQPEPDLKILLNKGQLIKGKIIFKSMSPCNATENCAQFCDKHPKTCRIATGWALGIDGVWRQHSWLATQEQSCYRNNRTKKRYITVLYSKMKKQYVLVAAYSRYKKVI